MESYVDPRDPYERIAADIRARIMSGELAPGDDLPITSELTAQYAVASATIQKAFDMLKTEGWIVGTRGRGRQVRPSQLRVVTAGTYFDPKEADVAYKLLSVGETRPAGDIATALGGATAILRHRLMHDAGGPLEVDWSYYPAEIAAGTELAQTKRIRGGAQRVLDGLGLPERGFDDIVSARAATEYEARHLELPPGVPVLRILRTVYSDERRVTTVTVLIKAGHQMAQRYAQATRP